MREYARVYPSFWTGPTGKRLKECGVDSQLIALYVLTTSHSNMIGLYYLPVIYISYDTGIPFEGALEGLRSLESIEFCFHDEVSEFIWVPEMARFQVGRSLKPSDKQVKGIINLYNSLPNNPFLNDFYQKYKVAFHLNGTSPLEAPSKGLGCPSEAMQEQEQGQEQGKITVKGKTV